MKQKKQQRGNQPYYAQYLKKEESTPNESKPTKRAPRPRLDEETRFNKPTGYKSSFKPKTDDRPERKPFGEKRDFDRPDSRPERKPFGEKRDFDRRPDDRPERKPFGEKRDFDRRDDSRPERKPFGENRDFDRRPDSRPERKPFGEKRDFDRPDSHSERKPFGEKRDFDRRPDSHSERKPFGEKRDFERPQRLTDNEETSFRGKGKKPFEKPTETPNPEKKPRRDNTESRRVGEFTEAPRYNMERGVEKLPQKKKPVITKHNDDDLIRLNRYISNAGVCSRREADELIGMGQISVNGQVITELGYKVKRSDSIKYAGRLLSPEKMVYILINKPKDYITTTEDPEDRHTVMELIEGACAERVYPVGRLDRNTTGLLLFTNDGELAEKLMHPSNQVQKIYQVELDKPIATEDFEKIREGLELEDGFIKPDELGIVTPDGMVIGIEIHSGRNRIVRRIFEHLGYEVLKLDRTVYGGLNKKELPRGKWRFLTEREVVRIKYML